MTDSWLPRITADRVGRRLAGVVALGNRFIGSDGERAARAQLGRWYSEAGLAHVHEEPLEVRAYLPGAARCSSKVGETYEPVKGLQFTSAGQVRARAVYVGRPDLGSDEQWRSGLDRRSVALRGRIAVLHCSYPWLYVDELCDRGAVGVVVISDAPDGLVQNLTARFYRGAFDAETVRAPLPVPGLVLEREAGWLLLSDLSQGPVELEIVHEADYELVQTANVVGELPGSTDRPAVVVGAHYDTQFDGPGANDDSSGLSVLLELAEACRGRRPARALIFAAFADEEHGLNGSLSFVARRHPVSERLAAMVNFDSPGWSRLAKRCLHANEAMTELATRYATEAGWEPQVLVRAEDVRVTDHNAFADAGVPACELEHYPPGNPYYHTHADTLDRIDAEAVAWSGQAGAAIAWQIANSDHDLPWEQTRSAPLETATTERQIADVG